MLKIIVKCLRQIDTVLSARSVENAREAVRMAESRNEMRRALAEASLQAQQGRRSA